MMESDKLERLPARAKIAYAIMCFGRYVGFVYAGVDFTPVAEVMWHLADGSVPAEEAASDYQEIIPENLFSCKTYPEYKAQRHCRLSPQQYAIFTRLLNPNDWNLNSMMKHICQLASEQSGSAAQSGETDSMAHLKAIMKMLTDRRISLPDPAPLTAYARTLDAPDGSGRTECAGKADDPEERADDSVPDRVISGKPAAQTDGANNVADLHEEKKKNAVFKQREDTDTGYNKSELLKNNGTKAFAGTGRSAVHAVEGNGCRWDILEDGDGCIILRCWNDRHLREVEIPAELKGLPVTGIGDHAFRNDPESDCRVIESLRMPDTVRTVGEGFFTKCIYLRQVKLSAALERLGGQAFRGASRLERVEIGDRCSFIGDYFCADAVALRSAVIGSAIESVGQFTFYNTPAMIAFRCEGQIRSLGYGSFWCNKWADSIIFNPSTEMLRFCKGGTLLYRYVSRTPAPRLFFDPVIRYVYDFAFGGDAWNSGEGIRDIYLPGAEIIGVNAFKKVPNATVHLSASRMEQEYGSDYEYTLAMVCQPARVVFDQP